MYGVVHQPLPSICIVYSIIQVAAMASYMILPAFPAMLLGVLGDNWLTYLQLERLQRCDADELRNC